MSTTPIGGEQCPHCYCFTLFLVKEKRAKFYCHPVTAGDYFYCSTCEREFVGPKKKCEAK
jgi:hypothetical protein